MREQDEIDEKVSRVLEKIENKVLVFSGKGGVGKSTVAANLALALAKKGRKVGLLDVDIHGPDLAKILGVEHKKTAVSKKNTIVPVLVSENLKLISMSFFLARSDLPIIWRGPLKIKAIQQFLSDVEWGELDWLIADSPPGTGDEPLSVAQLIPATGAIVVTTPQEVSLLDSRKAVTFARHLGLRLIGIIENMSGFVCPYCKKRIDLFKKGGGEKMAEEAGVPFLGRVPLDPNIVKATDSGKPFVLEQPDSEAARAFSRIVEEIEKTKSGE